MKLLVFFLAVVVGSSLGKTEESSLSLSDVLGLENSQEILRFERDIKEEITRHLREAFDKALKKILDAVAKGKEVNQEALKQLKELQQDLLEVDFDFGEDPLTEELKERLKNKFDEHLKSILDKMGIDKRSIDDPMMSVFEDLNLRNFFIRLREMILEKMDLDSLKTSFGKIVGQTTQSLCDFLMAKGKTKVMNFFERLMDKDMKKRAVSDLHQDVEDYLKNLESDFEQKLKLFREWLKNSIDKSIQSSKKRIDFIRGSGREMLSKLNNMSKETANEVKIFIEKYKHELGHMYEVLLRRVNAIIWQ